MKFCLACQASQTDAHYLKCLKLANRYGFDMFQVYDDLLFKSAWSVLDQIAPHVRDSRMNLTIGPGDTNPFHYHPAIIAAYISYLDQQTTRKQILMLGRWIYTKLYARQ